MTYNHSPYIAHRPGFMGGHGLYGGRAGVAFTGGFHAITPHGGPGFRAEGFSGFGHTGIARSYPLSGRIGGGAPTGGFHGGERFHGGGGGHR
jgi:hypothetical protein